MNSPTSQRLERLDGAKFQLLTNALLMRESAYKALIETGGNAQGQTIKSPLDAFCLVLASNPPHFVLVEHTTTAPTNRGKGGNLATKWEGDLKKAINQATQLRAKHPQAHFTVVLSCSHRPPEQLVKDVYKIAQQAGVHLDIWEQSRITRVLDTTSEGHYLRRIYLGVMEEMLSLPLLVELCQKSLDEYEQFIGLSANSIVREEELQLSSALSSQSKLHFVVGESGSGKSTLLYRFAQNRIEEGGYALWLPAHYLNQRLSLPATIRLRLRELYPSLMEESLDGLLASIISPQHQLLLVVDDPNRENNASQIVSHLLSWVRPSHQENTTNSQTLSSGPSYKLVCPIWPTMWAAYSSEASKWCGTTSLGTFSRDDAASLVTRCLHQAGSMFLSRNIEELAEMLSFDPFLIGLWSEMVLEPGTSPDYARCCELTSDVIERYVADRCSNAATQSRFIDADFRDALLRFGALLLEKRELSPSWAQYRAWVREIGQEQDAEILSELSNRSTLWRVQTQGKQRRPAFRHDRLRHHFLVEAMEDLLRNSPSTPDAQTLALCGDPFFAEVTGEAFRRLSPERSHAWLWGHLLQTNPLAFAIAYRGFVFGNTHSLSRKEEGCRDQLRERFHQWALAAKLKPGLTTTVEAIGQVFYHVEDSNLPQILAPLDSNWAIGLALLRNGVISTGTLKCVGWNWGRADVQKEPSIVEGKLYHRAALIDQISRWLVKDLDDEQEAEHWQNAVAMAGTLAVGELINPLNQAWHKVPQAHQKGFLPLFLWSALNCLQSGFEEDTRAFLDELLDVWAALSDEPKSDSAHSSDRIEVGRQVHYVRHNSWAIGALEFLIESAQRRSELNHGLTMTMSNIDSPLVLAFFVEQEEQKVSNGYSRRFVIDHWSDHWGKNRHYLSSESLRCVRELWQDTSLSDHGRCFAFHYWRTNPDGDDPALLNTVASSDPFYYSALQTRVQRGDLSAIPEVLSLSDEDFLLQRDLHQIWCPAIKDATKALAASIVPSQKEYVEQSPGRAYDLVKILQGIPTIDAEEILLENWDNFRYIPIFLCLALWVGTFPCQKLVQETIDLYPSTVNVFSYLQSTLPIWANEGEEDQARPRIMTFITNVLPYWDRVNGFIRLRSNHSSNSLKPTPYSGSSSTPTLDEIMSQMDTMNTNDLIEACFRVKEFDWARQRLHPIITENQRREFFPTDEDLEEQLNHILGRGFDLSRHAYGVIYSYFTQSERRGIPTERLLQILLRWTEKEPDKKHLTLAVAAVQEHGSRDDYQRIKDVLASAPLTEGEKDNLRATLENIMFIVMRRNLV